jgi:hypothetical protein
MENMEQLTVGRAEELLCEWASAVADRDVVVLSALAAGVSKVRIHALTGLARTTINDIEKSVRNRP